MNRQQRRAAAHAPSAEALHQRGIALYLEGQRDAAITAITDAIRADPRQPLYHFNLARMNEEAERHDQAIAFYRRAIALHPHYTEALNNLGAVLRATSNFPEAVIAFRRAIAADQNFAFAHHNLGCVLAALGQIEEAIAHLRTATRLAPNYPEAHFNLGAAYCQGEHFAHAAAAFTAALALKPDWPEALNNMGVALAGLDDPVSAETAYCQAIALKPDFADAYYNLGKALKAQRRLTEASQAYAQALALNPNHAQAENNFGIALDQLGQKQDAMAHFRRAIALAPDFADAHFNLGTSLLTSGDFAQGWAEFEWRFASTQMRAHQRNFTQPRWRGQEGPGTLLLHAEQGFGDTLQFCRYAPLAAARGWRVILEVQAPLTRLMRRLDGVSEIFAQGQTLPAFDAQLPLLSLPHVFGTEEKTIPSTTPYLHVPEAEITDWGRKLPAGKRIGLCWAGNPRAFSRVLAEVDSRRSIAPDILLPLLTQKNLIFCSLQKDGPPMPHPIIDLMPQIQDFADTAALIMNLDLVISVDTAIAHLAGALGKPVWLLNRHDGCWRWLENRTDSPWYPTMRLYTQPAPGAWTQVIEAIQQDLNQPIFS
jgi:tetratricopeptide (TPR) repeat protein